MTKIDVLDSTLRDGAQGEKISYSVQDKLSIAKILADLGVDFIEAGTPFSSPKDIEVFENLKGCYGGKIVAFSSTRRKDTPTCECQNISTTLAAETAAVSVFGKSLDMHVKNVLKTTLSENINMIYESVRHFKSQNKYVIYDAEHFFDAMKTCPNYAIETLKAAKRAGADVLCLCDTNGAALPDFVYDTVKNIAQKFNDIKIGIHCHDDMGLAIANTIMAVKAGATHIQGTFIGIGERCGNANLSAIIPTLQLKCGYDILPNESIAKLTSVANKIAELSNISLNPSMPYVGNHAFSHKAGMHSDAVIKDTSSFEHISPETVGNTRKLLLSEMSGRKVILKKIQTFYDGLDSNSEDIKNIMKQLKLKESIGYQYEGAEASFQLLVMKTIGLYSQAFDLVQLKCINEQPAIDGISATATVKIKAFGEAKLAVAEGEGPVNALDIALRSSLINFYPEVASITLYDYKVRVLSPKDATAAKVRVLITSTDGKDSWTTVGVSTDIIEASWLALVDSFEYKLLMKK